VRVSNIFGSAESGTYAVSVRAPAPVPAQPPAYLDESGDAEGASARGTAAYEGFVYDDGGTVRGTLTVSAKAAVKKVTKPVESYTTHWTFTAKAVLQAATVSFSGKAVGAVEALTLVTKGGVTLDVTLGADTVRGTVSGGKVGGTLNVAGARNAFADKKDAAAQERLAGLKGAYNVALVGVSGAQGGEYAGYLTLSAGNAGAVKIAGKLADGTAVSGAAKLLEGLNADGWYAVALHKPLYTKKGFVGGLLWLNPDDKVIRVDTGYGWFVDWVCGDPKKGVFEKELDVVGGWFGGAATVSGRPLYLCAAAPEDLPPPAASLDGGWVSAAFPWEPPVTVSGAKWSLPKATAPKKVGEAYDYSGVNPSGATLSYAAKTGLFKGAFKLYCDGLDAKGKPQHQAVSVSYAGVLTPVRDAAFAEWPVGLGAGTATVDRQKKTIPVFLAE
jgi:hypothetical protein